MSRIIVMDEAWPLAGQVEAYREAYLADYAPGKNPVTNNTGPSK